MPPPALRPDLIVRFPRRAGEPALLLPVRSRIGGDLRFFLIAWMLGFVAFLVLIA